MSDHSRLRDAFDHVPRTGFLPSGQRHSAGLDTALPIGHGQTNSQPSTVWAMLDLLEVQAGQRVLDVGCGSGWSTALLARLVGAEGSVSGVEIVPELVAWGSANLEVLAMPWATIRQAEPGVLGLPGEAPFDRVLVSAEASHLPETLVGQLGPGGVLVVPVAGRMTVVRRTPEGRSVESEGRYAFVPLVEPD